MVGGTCNNQSRRAAEETMVAVMVIGSGDNRDNGNKGGGDNSKRDG